tara:strand:+ start:21 stop:227 length:207 start_codon:yes stop_codon:yes gene_type:complete
MEKMLIKNNQDVKDAITFFGIEWKELIKEEAKDFPFILVSFYANDIEFGEIYRFTSIEISDFRQLIIN